MLTLQARKPARQFKIVSQGTRKKFDNGFLKAGITIRPEKPGLGYNKRCAGHPGTILRNILASGQRTILAKPLQRAQHMCGNNFEIGARHQDLNCTLQQKVKIGPSLIQTDDPLVLGKLDELRLAENAFTKLGCLCRQPR